MSARDAHLELAYLGRGLSREQLVAINAKLSDTKSTSGSSTLHGQSISGRT